MATVTYEGQEIIAELSEGEYVQVYINGSGNAKTLHTVGTGNIAQVRFKYVEPYE